MTLSSGVQQDGRPDGQKHWIVPFPIRVGSTLLLWFVLSYSCHGQRGIGRNHKNMGLGNLSGTNAMDKVSPDKAEICVVVVVQVARSSLWIDRQ